MDKFTLTRKELYDLIWSTPMSKLSVNYSISVSKLRSICIKMDVPLPETGFWQKLQYKKEVCIKELSHEYNGDNEISIHQETEKEKRKQSETKRVMEIKSDPNMDFTVPSKLTNPDKLIIAAKDDLATKKTLYGMDYGLINTSSGFIDIKVSPVNVGRALRFMDALIKLLRKRGYEIVTNYETTYAVVLGEEIVICLQEKLRIEEKPNNYGWNSREYFPSGILTFRVWKDFRFRQKIWYDGKQLIENQLASILAHLEVLAEKEKERRIRNEIEHKIWLEEQKIENEIRERKENEYKKFKKLFIQANLYQKANFLREYVNTVEAYAIKNGNHSTELKGWINWATNKINWFDPLINQEDPDLDEEDKKSIIKDFQLKLH